MTVIAEAFSEMEWGEPELAQEQRDLRLAQLEAQGLICRSELLYRVMDGRRVYVVTAESPEAPRQESHRHKMSRTDRSDRSKRRMGGGKSKNS